MAPGGEESGGEPNPEVDRLLRETGPQGTGKTIAFLGEAGAGRTVVAALLKHTLSTKWVPGSNGRWDALTVSGHDEINGAIRGMKGGLFPSPTVKDDYPALRIDLHRMRDAPSKIALMLRGIPGESYFERLSGSPPDGIDGPLLELLRGDGAYIAHATAYILMISCEDAGEWDTDKPRAVNAIKAIHAIKERMHCLDPDGRFMAPVALVFTKGDTLPAEHAQKPARDLAGVYRDLASTLRLTHSGPLACFKVQVATRGASLGQGSGGPGGRGPLQRAGSDARDHGEGEGDEGDEGDEEPAPAARPAVPLSYSHRAYQKLVTWLVEPR